MESNSCEWSFKSQFSRYIYVCIILFFCLDGDENGSNFTSRRISAVSRERIEVLLED